MTAKAVCSKGFRGSYYPKIYDYQHFAESITEAESRGYVLHNDEATRCCKKLWKPLVSGEYDSVLQDCEYGGNRFGEFVVVDADQCYPEYSLWYRRIFGDTGYLDHLDPLEPSAFFDVSATRLACPAGAVPRLCHDGVHSFLVFSSLFGSRPLHLR